MSLITLWLLLLISSVIMLSLAWCHNFTSLLYFKVEKAINSEKEKHSIELNELEERLTNGFVWVSNSA